MKYLSVQRKEPKYSQSWQHQHAADELKTYGSGQPSPSMVSLILMNWTLPFPLSAIKPIQSGRMKTAEERMKELQKLMEYGRNYQT